MTFLTLLILASQLATGSPGKDSTMTSASPVILGGDTLFMITSRLGAFTAAERAQRLNERLVEVAASGPDSLALAEHDGTVEIVSGTTVLLTVSDQDARSASVPRDSLARQRLELLRHSLTRHAEELSRTSLLVSGAIALGYLILLVGVFWLLRATFPKLYDRLEAAEGRSIRSITIRGQEIVSAGALGNTLQIIARSIRLLLSLLAVYVTLTRIAALFVFTRHLGIEPYLFGFLAAILVTTIAYGVIRGIVRAHTWSTRLVVRLKGTLIRPVRLKSVEVLSEDRIVELLIAGTKLGRLILILFAIYLYVSILFGLFPFTATWSATLFGFIMTPLGNALSAFVRYLPNLFTIFVISALTYYALQFLGFISRELARGTLTLPGFYPDWAIPTFKIVRFLVIVFAIVVIFPYLPFSDSPFFQGISVFLGILFSIGSSSAIGNAVSGVVLTYMRPFQVGDRVKIADTVGDIVEKTILVTRVRTIKNVDITIPNAMVLGAHIINYSSSAEHRGLILHTTVTIGYDTDWKIIHRLLIEAAGKTEGILTEPAPFVLQTALNDFYVSYELNAYTNSPSTMAGTYSRLHQNIQDVFNAAGVEIMSPHYSALRDGNDAAMPGKAEPAESRSFKIRGHDAT